MNRPEAEHSESLVHVQSIDVLKLQTANEFDTMVGALLKDAPNRAAKGSRATDKAVEFQFRASIVRASYHEALGSPGTYRLDISTPIAVDNLERDPMSIHPQNPHEIVELESSPIFGTLNLRVRAVNLLGGFGHEITLEQYTAGGLLPPINTLGRGKIAAFQRVNALFQSIVPQNPLYRLMPTVSETDEEVLVVPNEGL